MAVSTHLPNQKGGCVKSGNSGALKSDRLGVNCKANKCSDAGTGDLGVLTTCETSQCFSVGDAATKTSKFKLTHPPHTVNVRLYTNKVDGGFQ